MLMKLTPVPDLREGWVEVWQAVTVGHDHTGFALEVTRNPAVILQ